LLRDLNRLYDLQIDLKRGVCRPGYFITLGSPVMPIINQFGLITKSIFAQEIAEQMVLSH